jgi:UDP-N-acetylmuramoyl-L-alanyl-D-glutamate--2,6-diaminopimelate ligase
MAENRNQIEMEQLPAFEITPARALEVLQGQGELSEPSHNRAAATAPLRICWDTRALPASQDVLFIARKGNSFDGHVYAKDFIDKCYYFVGNTGQAIRQLREKGIPEPDVQAVVQSERFIAVQDTEAALRIVLNAAARFLPQEFTSIAITGTSGKTSITQITAHLWEKLGNEKTLRIGTLGIQVGDSLWDGSYPTMPDYPGFLSALSAAHQDNIHKAVFEATSHGLIGRRLGDWTADVVVFSNFSQDHLDFHKTMAAYRSCKGILFERHMRANGTAIFNADDTEWQYFLSRVSGGSQKVIGYGSAAERAAFWRASRERSHIPLFLEIENPVSDHYGIRGIWKLYREGEPMEQAEYACPLLGSFQHHNLAAAAASMVALGFSIKDITSHTEQVPGIPGRLEHASEPLAAPHPTVLVDYAHKPDALEKTLQTLKGITPSSGKLVCVFGCGGDRDPSKRPIMGEISSRLADITYITSDNPRTEDPGGIVAEVMRGVTNNCNAHSIVDRREAIFAAICNAGDNDVIVIAGKGHENYQIIGTKKIPMSDFEMARTALLERKNSKRSE